MKRVVILGPGASGKSTLAFQLGQITGLRLIELDKIFWRPGLVATPRDEWEKVQRIFIDENGWIADGDLGPYDSVEVRLRAADTIIFFGFLVRPLRLACSSAIARTGRFLAVDASLSQPPPFHSHGGDRQPRRRRGLLRTT
jgi:adenylate kinase family enzyme